VVVGEFISYYWDEADRGVEVRAAEVEVGVHGAHDGAAAEIVHVVAAVGVHGAHVCSWSCLLMVKNPVFLFVMVPVLLQYMLHSHIGFEYRCMVIPLFPSIGCRTWRAISSDMNPTSPAFTCRLLHSSNGPLPVVEWVFWNRNWVSLTVPSKTAAQHLCAAWLWIGLTWWGSQHMTISSKTSLDFIRFLAYLCSQKLTYSCQSLYLAIYSAINRFTLGPVGSRRRSSSNSLKSWSAGGFLALLISSTGRAIIGIKSYKKKHNN